MNTSYKAKIDNAIASGFKSRIAQLNDDIDKVKLARANDELEYKRMISEDLTVVSKTSSTTFVDRCISLAEKLHELERQLEDAEFAFIDWKSIANYNED